MIDRSLSGVPKEFEDFVATLSSYHEWTRIRQAYDAAGTNRHEFFGRSRLLGRRSKTLLQQDHWCSLV